MQAACHPARSEFIATVWQRIHTFCLVGPRESVVRRRDRGALLRGAAILAGLARARVVVERLRRALVGADDEADQHARADAQRLPDVLGTGLTDEQIVRIGRREATLYGFHNTGMTYAEGADAQVDYDPAAHDGGPVRLVGSGT